MNLTHGELPRLIAITDWQMPLPLMLERIEMLASLGPRVAIQHRNPSCAGRLFWQQAIQLKGICQKYQNPLFINGRLDVARLLEAHLHLPSTAPATTELRPLMPAGTLISVAVHSTAEALRHRGADLALLSPVFRPRSKIDSRPILGVDGFIALSTALTCPSYALGGIDGIHAGLLPRGTPVASLSLLHSKNLVQEAQQILSLPN